GQLLAASVDLREVDVEPERPRLLGDRTSAAQIPAHDLSSRLRDAEETMLALEVQESPMVRRILVLVAEADDLLARGLGAVSQIPQPRSAIGGAKAESVAARREGDGADLEEPKAIVVRESR